MIKAAQATDETRTLTESAYRLIRSDILSGLVAPKDKLHISDLSQRHGTSASAIREALSRLVSEGLATMKEQKGFRVAPMSVREFKEITDLRVMLETEAIRRALALGGDEWESEHRGYLLSSRSCRRAACVRRQRINIRLGNSAPRFP